MASPGNHTHTHTHTRLTALCPGLPGWASTRKAKPIWILLKQETASGSGISWAICKSAPRSRQITTPAPHRSAQGTSTVQMYWHTFTPYSHQIYMQYLVQHCLVLISQYNDTILLTTTCKMTAGNHGYTAVFHRPDTLPAAQTTVSKHWRHTKAFNNLTRGKVLSWESRSPVYGIFGQ